MLGRPLRLMLLTGLLGLTSAGCTIGNRIWTQSVTETMSLGSGVYALSVQTHNGRIEYEGRTGPTDSTVTVTRRAGGRTLADAERAYEALEVFSESPDGGHYRIGWRWKQPRRSSWSADVSFSIQGPAGVRFDAETHNGSVRVANVAGEVRLETHNGGINVTSSGPLLRAETHNGSIDAGFDGGEIHLSTHNGAVTADLSRSASIGGTIRTHNGAVRITVSDRTSSNVTCTTHNGRVSFEPAMRVSKVGRTRVEGQLGDGGRPLAVTTHNGSIRMKKNDGSEGT
jgi:hypothetical protein